MAQVLRALALVDAVGHIVLGNVGLIGSVVDNHSADPVRVVHPLLQLILCQGRSRWDCLGKHR